MIYSSKIINAAAIAIAALAVITCAYWLLKKSGAPQKDERAAICRELDLTLDLRDDSRLTMQSQEDREDRCNKILRGIPR